MIEDICVAVVEEGIVEDGGIKYETQLLSQDDLSQLCNNVARFLQIFVDDFRLAKTKEAALFDHQTSRVTVVSPGIFICITSRSAHCFQVRLNF